MSKHLDRGYLAWLSSQVFPDGSRTYEDLLLILQQKEFVWLIPNDDNRVSDGLDLRVEYFRDSHMWINGPGASVLEVLIGLSRRLSFTAGETPQYWAWRLIKNLKLDRAADPIGRRKGQNIDEELDVLIWRTYDHHGQGGFFPLSWPEQDQSKTELWYQMNAYIHEQFEM